MESTSCFFAAASAVSVLSLLWALREGRGARVWLAVVLAGASLYQILPPALHGVLLLGCSLVLIGATGRAVQLLPVKSRAVLITGEGPITSDPFRPMGVVDSAPLIFNGSTQVRPGGMPAALT